ncbi:MAG: 2OG-Fe(II) oxygenase [Deltaproteobacteria bacterium]|nr:2OG-Fe(II) oxygenase [Deltaproteobacteria bacterium]
MAHYAGHFDFSRPLIRVLPGLFSADECDRLIARVRDGEWLAATVNGRNGREIASNIRDNSTAILRDDSLGQLLFERVQSSVPETMQADDFASGQRVTMRVVGVYSPLRVYRYEEGQKFGLHHDQSYEGPDNSHSLLTLMVYLNDDFEGGETDFPEEKQRVVPVRGSVLWFQHMLLHAGRAVTKGTKYVLRSEVLYRSVSE